jgi:glycosyltransferase involved in cell wall biosynthesis
MSPGLSIIIPVHNVARYLPSCIESIINQRCKNIEVVLVNDRSTDECAAICDRYAALHDGIRVVHLAANLGVAEARNQGLAAATGDYITFVDGDDCLLPGSLDRLQREIERLAPIDVVICRYVSQSRVLSNDAMFVESALGRKLDAEAVLRHLTDVDFYLDHCWPFVISRELIDRHDVGFINSMIAEDAEYIVRILTLASSIAYCDGAFYLYRERPGSLKNSKGALATVSFLHVAYAMQRIMDCVADSAATKKLFVASQIRHSFGAFAARLSLLDDVQLSAISSLVNPEHLPPQRAGSHDVAAVLSGYRRAADEATLSLVSAAKDRPIFIYCIGPSAEAVIRTLQRERYDIRAVVDDNPAQAGRTLLDVPVVPRGHLHALSVAERAAALILICTQKRVAYEKIAASLKDQGFADAQIAHRVFAPGVPRLRRSPSIRTTIDRRRLRVGARTALLTGK